MIKYNQFALKAEGWAPDILSIGVDKDPVPSEIIEAYERLVTLFFGPVEWTTQKEPYIFYKHLFRKFVKDRTRQGNSWIARLEGSLSGHQPHHATIYNSIETNESGFKIPDQLTKRVKEILWYDLSGLKEIIMDRLTTQSIDQVAKDCLVHPEAINKVLKNEKLPLLILKQINQCLQDQQ